MKETNQILATNCLMKNLIIQNLINYFSNTPTLTRNNFNDIFNGLSKLISQTIDLHAPLKRYSHTQK